MKRILILIAFLSVLSHAYSQVKDYEIHATEVLKTDSIIVIDGNTLEIESTSTNGQFIRKVNGKWINVDFTGAGSDSIKFEDTDNYLKDWRGGSVSDSTLIQFQNITLKEGDTRTISVEQSTTGAGNHLIVKAAADDDGQDGGNLYLQGGGGDEFGDVYIGSGNQYSTVYFRDTTDMGGLRIKNLAPAVNDSDAVTLGQISGLTKNVYSISLPYATTVQGRVNGAVEGTDYETGWTLSAATNQIDLVVTHGFGRRVAEVNIMTVNGTIEQLLRPFAGAYSGWQTNDENTLQINSLATTPLPLVIYIIFE